MTKTAPKQEPLKELKEHEFKALTPEQQQAYITNHAAKFCDMVLLNTGKWRQPPAIKALGFILAAVIINKMHRFVSEEEFMRTVRAYVYGVKVQTGAATPEPQEPSETPDQGTQNEPA